MFLPLACLSNPYFAKSILFLFSIANNSEIFRARIFFNKYRFQGMPWVIGRPVYIYIYI